MNRQLFLNLSYDTARDEAAEFFVSDANRSAVEWLQRLKEWHLPGIVIYGAPATGKSHLAKAWAANANAVVIREIGDIEAYLSGDSTQPVVVDDADFFITDRARAESLFHLYQRLVATDAKMLLLARKPAQQWQTELADCASRMRALPQVEISTPDDQLVEMLLLKYFAGRGISADPEIINYLVPRVPRSAPALQALVMDLDNDTMETQKRLNLTSVRAYCKDKGL